MIGSDEILEANGIWTERDGRRRRRPSAARDCGERQGEGLRQQPASDGGVLRQLATELALVHSQGETWVVRPEQQRLLLDRFEDLDGRRRAPYAAWRAASEKLTQLQSESKTACAWPIYGAFRAGDRCAGLAAEDEDTQLEAERRVLSNAEKLYTAAMSAHDLLYESEGAAEATLGQALKHLRSWRGTTHGSPNRCCN